MGGTHPDLFGGETPVVTSPQSHTNHMVGREGPDPEGRLCFDCAHLVDRDMKGDWQTCTLAGRKKQHLGFWPACSKITPARRFEPRWI